MLQVINTQRTFNQVHVVGAKPRVINLEAMGRPGSSAPIEADEEQNLQGSNFRVMSLPDPIVPVVEPPVKAPPKAAPTTSGNSEGK